MTTILMTYPEYRYVSEERVRSWAEDDVANGDLPSDVTQKDVHTMDIEDLIRLMCDTGSVSLVVSLPGDDDPYHAAEFGGAA